MLFLQKQLGKVNFSAPEGWPWDRTRPGHCCNFNRPVHLGLGQKCQSSSAERGFRPAHVSRRKSVNLLGATSNALQLQEWIVANRDKLEGPTLLCLAEHFPESNPFHGGGLLFGVRQISSTLTG